MISVYNGQTGSVFLIVDHGGVEVDLDPNESTPSFVLGYSFYLFLDND
jgi:hypothetical protein